MDTETAALAHQQSVRHHQVDAPHAVIVRQDEPATILNAIVALAKDPAVDVTKLQALMEMQERWQARAAEVEFNRALAALPPFRVKKNGRIPLPSKDGIVREVPFAKWEDIDTAISGFLNEAGFRLSFNSAPRQGEGGGLTVTGTLLHRDGHSRSADMPLALDTGPGRNNLQAMGSTLSYGKRYCAEMLLNIVREGDDDDGAKGGAEFITDEQCAKINSLVMETKWNLDSFLDLLGVESIPLIQKAQFVTAENLLIAKREQRKAAKPKAPPFPGDAPNP